MNGNTQVSSYIKNDKKYFSPEDIRILRRNLMYLTNIPQILANTETLQSYNFIGQYGIITKILVNKETSKNKKKHTYSAYVYFERELDCAIAILSLNGFRINNQILNASFGMTRYCCFFLKNSICGKRNCSYVHYIADPQDCTSNKDRGINKKIRKLKKDKIIEFIIRKNFDLENLKNSKNISGDNFCFCFPHKYETYKKIIKYQRKLRSFQEKQIKQNLKEKRTQIMNKNHSFETKQIFKQHLFYPFNLAHNILKSLTPLENNNKVKVQSYKNFINFQKKENLKNNIKTSFNSENTQISISSSDEKSENLDNSNISDNSSNVKRNLKKESKNYSIDRLVDNYFKQKNNSNYLANKKSRFSFVKSNKNNNDKPKSNKFWTKILNCFENQEEDKLFDNQFQMYEYNAQLVKKNLFA